MGLKCQQINEIMEKYAPKNIAEDWDNVGLQIGHPGNEVHKILVTLDVDDAVIEEAIDQGIDMIISHHPLIFKPLKNIRFDQLLGGMVSKLIKNNICLYAAHTNLDSADKGVNTVLAEVLNLENVEILAPTTKEKLCKLAVFIPEDHADRVMKAITDAGAGWIGNYSHCTFQGKGKGTFKPLEGTKPFIGKIGEVENSAEVRLETILPEKILGRVIKAMLKAHPYEEVAYDIYPLMNEGKNYGLGKIGYLPEPMVFQEFLLRVKQGLNIDILQFGGKTDKKIHKVALCGGSGASLIANALFKGADVLVTGDIKYHEGQDCLRQGMCFVNAGHHATEAIIIPVLAKYLDNEINNNKKCVEVITSQINTNPFLYL